jgi:hypothetical protein
METEISTKIDIHLVEEASQEEEAEVWAEDTLRTILTDLTTRISLIETTTIVKVVSSTETTMALRTEEEGSEEMIITQITLEAITIMATLWEEEEVSPITMSRETQVLTDPSTVSPTMTDIKMVSPEAEEEELSQVGMHPSSTLLMISLPTRLLRRSHSRTQWVEEEAVDLTITMILDLIMTTITSIPRSLSMTKELHLAMERVEVEQEAHSATTMKMALDHQEEAEETSTTIVMKDSDHPAEAEAVSAATVMMMASTSLQEEAEEASSTKMMTITEMTMTSNLLKEEVSDNLLMTTLTVQFLNLEEVEASPNLLLLTQFLVLLEIMKTTTTLVLTNLPTPMKETSQTRISALEKERLLKKLRNQTQASKLPKTMSAPSSMK